MNPKTGDILAMATYPDYNLNKPFSKNDSISTKKWNALSGNKKSDFFYSMWNNPAVQNTYEPGSTFKLITAAAALEENLAKPDHSGDFSCNNGYETVVAGEKPIACWRSHEPHGKQSLKQALRKFL